MGPIVVLSLAATFVLAVLGAAAWNGANVEHTNTVLAAHPTHAIEPVLAHAPCCRAWREAHDPHGEERGLRLDLLNYPQPVFGRSADGLWIVVRVGAIRPHFQWIDASEITISPSHVEFEDLPIALTGETEVFRLSPEGSIAERVAATRLLRRWQWQADASIFGGSYDTGVFSPQTGEWEELVQVPRASWVVHSPDARYVATGNVTDLDKSTWGTSLVTITSLANGRAVSFKGVAELIDHPEHPNYWNAALYWSPDSTTLLSWLHPLDYVEDDGVWLLHPDGFSVQLPQHGFWLPDSTVLTATGEIYSTRGEVLRQIDVSGLEFALRPPARCCETTSRTEMLMLAVQAGEEDEEHEWVRVDLIDGARTLLPSPIRHLLADGRVSWEAVGSFNRSAVFFSRPVAERTSTEGAALYLYDLLENRIRPIDLPVFVNRSSGWSHPQTVWSDDLQQVALWDWNSEHLLVVDVDTLQLSTISTTMQGNEIVPVAWSPDGRRLLIKEVGRTIGTVDSRGLASIFGYTFSWWTVEFRVINVADGRTLDVLRSRYDDCSLRYTAAWSPDGGLIAFSGEERACMLGE